MAITLSTYVIGEAAFAKVVETKNGEAILLAGHVFEVSGPVIDGQSPANILSKALRQTLRSDEAQTSTLCGDLSDFYERGLQAGNALRKGTA